MLLRLKKRLLSRIRRQLAAQGQVIAKASNSTKAYFAVYGPDRAKMPSKIPHRVEAQFNPSTYGFQRTATWNDASEGQKTNQLQFDKNEPRQITVDLVFDALSLGETDVRRIIKPLELYAKPICRTGANSEKPRPPRVVFGWGGFHFLSVIASINVTFTYFSERGVPVRAKVQVALREYENPLLIAKRLALGDPETFYRVRRNDTLIGIAARELNDPALWRVLARANDIDNPLALTPGDTLFIPEIENDYQHQVRT